MLNKYVSFDLETYGSVEHPEGITCAATLTESGDLKVWKPQEGSDGRYKPKMSVTDLCQMVRYLEMHLVNHNRPPLAWNGLSFDFRVLFEQLEGNALHQGIVKALALNQIDPALHFLSEMGYMCGLEKASVAMGASGKLTGMDGHKAAELWMSGTREDQETILKYVAQDVVTTREVYELFVKYTCIRWVKGSGKIGVWIPKDRQPLTAKEVIDRGLVGRPIWWSGESYPWTKENVLGWLGESFL